MTIRQRKVKHPPDFCFQCGKTLEKIEFVLDFGTPAASFELCRSCIGKIHKRAAIALSKEATQ